MSKVGKGSFGGKTAAQSRAPVRTAAFNAMMADFT